MTGTERKGRERRKRDKRVMKEVNLILAGFLILTNYMGKRMVMKKIMRLKVKMVKLMKMRLRQFKSRREKGLLL